jgi:hypothetical protein
MNDIAYKESGDSAILTSDIDGEWIESDRIVLLPDWV